MSQRLHVIHPVVWRLRRGQVARVAARTRTLFRVAFRFDHRYYRAFGKIRPGQSIAVYQGQRVVGLLQFRVNGLEPFVTSRDQFLRLWGPIVGRLRWGAYRALQSFGENQDVYVEALWVSPKVRGGIVGALLVKKMMEISPAPISALARARLAKMLMRHGFVRRRDLRSRVIGLLSGLTPIYQERVLDDVRHLKMD